MARSAGSASPSMPPCAWTAIRLSRCVTTSCSSRAIFARSSSSDSCVVRSRAARSSARCARCSPIRVRRRTASTAATTASTTATISQGIPYSYTITSGRGRRRITSRGVIVSVSSW